MDNLASAAFDFFSHYSLGIKSLLVKEAENSDTLLKGEEGELAKGRNPNCHDHRR